MRFRPAFSLRTPLVLVTLVCVLCAWLVRERRLVTERLRALDDWTRMNVAITPPESLDRPNPALELSWIRRRMGDRAVAVIGVWVEHDPGEFERARRLFPEARVQWAAFVKDKIIPVPTRDYGIRKWREASLADDPLPRPAPDR